VVIGNARNAFWRVGKRNEREGTNDLAHAMNVDRVLDIADEETDEVLAHASIATSLLSVCPHLVS
jgi:hypothetical protein